MSCICSARFTGESGGGDRLLGVRAIATGEIFLWESGALGNCRGKDEELS